MSWYYYLQQRIQAQERVEQQKEAELHHLQTLAMMEKEKEMMQTATALPGHLEGQYWNVENSSIIVLCMAFLIGDFICSVHILFLVSCV